MRVRSVDQQKYYAKTFLYTNSVDTYRTVTDHTHFSKVCQFYIQRTNKLGVHRLRRLKILGTIDVLSRILRRTAVTNKTSEMFKTQLRLRTTTLWQERSESKTEYVTWTRSLLLSFGW